MADIIIACDEKDSVLGGFFEACKTHIDDFLTEQSITYSEIKSNQLNDLSVKMQIEGLPKFIFGAYSHGASSALLKSGVTEYVSIAKNGEAFDGGFVYTFSCSSGSVLGKDLIANNCQCFIGYRTRIYIWTNFFGTFIECINHGLIEFFKGADTKVALESMIEKYNEQIDLMYESNPLVAADLVANKRSLVMHGKSVLYSNF